LNTVAIALEENRRPDLTTTADTLIPGATCFFLEVAERYFPDYVGFARRYYRGKQFPLYQIVRPSNAGHFPWDRRATEPFKKWQPPLGAAPKGV
jgi:Domain of unknown function (DUF4262)